MKKSYYGEVSVSIEIRENAIIIDGSLSPNQLQFISELSEKLIPNGILAPTCSDCVNGGITIINPDKVENDEN